MSKFQELEQEHSRHAEESKRLLEAIKREIMALPDNPRIKRFPGNPHAFVVNWKDLGNDWSVEHHDFKKQYELVANEIGKAIDPSARLRQIVTEGKIRLSASRPTYSVNLHEDVIDNLCKMAGIRWKSIAEWPKGTCPHCATPDHSEDTHDTRREAENVTMLLRTQGFGGDRKAFPIRTLVEVA